MIAATVANGGTAYRPSLIYQIQEADGTMIRRPGKIRGNLLKDNGIREDQIELIRRGMWRVVNDPGGTGARAQISPSLEKREQHNFGETATKITTLGLSLSRHTKTRRSRWRCSCKVPRLAVRFRRQSPRR